MGKKYGVSEAKIRLAALLHDCARRFDRKELLRTAKKIGLKIDPVREFEPKLLHAGISAWLAKKEFGVKSSAVLGAIRKHTVGSENMSLLEKIIYLSDHIEEGRSFPGVAKIRELANQDLDRAVAESTCRMLAFLLENDLPIYSGTVKTRNWYLLKFKSKKQ